MSDEFHIRYYRWAKSCFNDELETGFPTLQQLDMFIIPWLLETLKPLDEGHRQLLVTGLLRRSHSYAVSLLNETPGAAEVKLMEWYLKRGKRFFETGEKFRAEERTRGTLLPKPEVRRRIVKSVADCFGKRVKSPVPGVTAWELTFEKCIVRTEVYVQGPEPDCDMGYYHEVLTRGGLRVMPFISILAWLGISGETLWKKMTEENISERSKVLQNVSAQFFAAVPSLMS